MDIPAGDGRVSALLLKKGFKVLPYDLFPKTFQVKGLVCRFADMTKRLPLKNQSVDLIVCEEGIEHIPDQLSLLLEFNRVLRKGGRLVLTTPSQSHLRTRLSRFLVGSDFWKRLPPSEVDAVWFAEKGRLYFGHLFLLDVNQLWVLSRLSGFDLVETRRTELGAWNIVLGPFLAPFIVMTYLWAYIRNRGKLNPTGDKAIGDLLRKQARLNLSPQTLFCKDIFWVLRKGVPLDERRRELLRNSGVNLWHHPRNKRRP